MDNLANNPSKIEEWHKRVRTHPPSSLWPARPEVYSHNSQIVSIPSSLQVQRAEALRTKPGQDRNARAHHAAQPGYKGPVILPNRG